MDAIGFDSSSRLLVFAPHPDDESLSTAFLLQHAAAAEAAVRVIYLTDGDDNPWPQRMLERRWSLREVDRKRWGKRRRAEALEALKELGIRGADARFLGYPDQKLATLLCGHPTVITDRLRNILLEWAPTHLAAPSVADTHPDHSAAAVMLLIALRQIGRTAKNPVVLSYVVHGRKRTFTRARGYVLTGAPDEISRKRMAIECHGTQTSLSRRRFLAYARRPERFAVSTVAP